MNGRRVAANRAAVATAMFAACFAISGCNARDNHENDARLLTGGEPSRGRTLIRTAGCGTCHEVGGVPGAVGKVGPPLTGIGQRSIIGGVLPNTPDNMVRWIVDPPRFDSATSMPRTDVSVQDARDIAAYLYSRP